MPTFEANGGGAADDRTKFTDSGADFQAYMAGWLLQPDVELPSYLEIVEVDESSGNWVRVKGDADTLATSGSTYRIHAPPGVDRATGALITGLEESGSQWLWAGYEYVPPMVGFADPAGQDPGTYGAQTGGNKLGSYHCWNRVYEPATGRWTTPDPVATPWVNAMGYVQHNPTNMADPRGLCPCTPPYPSEKCTIGTKTTTHCKSDCVLQPKSIVEGEDFAAGFYGDCSCTTEWECRYDTWDILQIVFTPQLAPKKWVKDGLFPTTCTECKSRSDDVFGPDPRKDVSNSKSSGKGTPQTDIAELEPWEIEEQEREKAEREKKKRENETDGKPIPKIPKTGVV